MPLGIGRHVDHQLTRDACLTILATKPELIGGRKLRFFEDVPYNGDWPHHSEHLLEVLRSAGAQFELERVDISGALDKKLQLLSVFGSQFKMAAMGPRVIKSARLSAANSFEYGEVLYELLTPPSRKVEPLACYVERERAAAMARTLGPWLRRQRGASLVTLVVPTAFGRWTEDMQLLLDVFPRARVQVLVDRSRLAETEALSSNRIVIKPVENGRWSWYAAAGRLLLSRPNPLVLVASPGREHHARWLSAGCFGSDPIVAPTLSDFMLGLRLASATGSKASIVSGHQPEGNLETAARLPLNAGPG